MGRILQDTIILVLILFLLGMELCYSYLDDNSLKFYINGILDNVISTSGIGEVLIG
jgi:hypothetical protein